MKLRTPPSAKPRQRYLALRVRSTGALGYENLKAAALNALLEWLGEDEFARAGLRFVKNRWSTSANAPPGAGAAGRPDDVFEARVLLECRPKYVDRAKVGLALITQIGDSRVAVSCVRVSGTIKGASR